MNHSFVYRPYRSHVWFVFFTIPIEVLVLVLAGYCLPYWDIALILTIMGIVCIGLSKKLYDTSNIVIFFYQEGLRIVGGDYKIYRYIPWKELSYAYYVQSFKGHQYLILSPKTLSHQEAKNFANKGANLSKLCVDYVVVIHIDRLQNTLQLKKFIENHISYIDRY